MAARRAPPKKPKAALQNDGGEYRFVIDAYSPATIPMARLAEYMRELADIFGEPTAVHFDRLEKGSTALLSKVDHEAIPKVRNRVMAVRRREGPSEGMRAYRAINKLLRDDNAIAHLKEKTNDATVIRFPGREEAEEAFPSVRQQGSVDGVIVGVGGKDQTVHIRLVVEGQQVSGCFTNRLIGKALGGRLYETVRLFGRGRWTRDSDGQWTLLSFKVESFEPLADVPLSEAIAGLRKLELGWDADALTELPAIRHGPRGNGRH
jgi:hypothetical protein